MFSWLWKSFPAATSQTLDILSGMVVDGVVNRWSDWQNVNHAMPDSMVYRVTDRWTCRMGPEDLSVLLGGTP